MYQEVGIGHHARQRAVLAANGADAAHAGGAEGGAGKGAGAAGFLLRWRACVNLTIPPMFLEVNYDEYASSSSTPA